MIEFVDVCDSQKIFCHNPRQIFSVISSVILVIEISS